MSTNPSAVFARELIATLVARGVQDFVLCPGSRSGPLAHALAEAGGDNPPLGAPRINLHVRIDERSAAFLALGIARGRALEGEPAPVAIITTSGTAVGNLLPAVMEAHHSGIPLVLLAADRPREMRGVGANQTTDQEGIFTGFVRWVTQAAAPEPDELPGRAAMVATKAVTMAMGDPDRDDMTGTPGPVHVGLEFREPLNADGGVWHEPPHVELTPSYGTRIITPEDIPAPLPQVERTVVIAGDGAGDVARRVAEVHGWPLLAEPTSGARVGDHCIGPYLDLLESREGRTLVDRVHQVVVIGRPTLSRPIQALIARAPALYVAAHGARWREAPRHASRVLREVPQAWLEGELAGDSEWLRNWQSAAQQIQRDAQPWNGLSAAAAFLQALGPRDVAIIGSSGPIRAVDRVAPAWSTERAPRLIANRGVSGIDGTVSTAVGVALATGQPTHALMGDVTFLHDVGGLLVGPLEQRPRLRVVVVNDGGGTIFKQLEHGSGPAALVDRVFTTPHGADLAALCAGYGVPHVVVRSADALARALAQPPGGFEVVEARIK